MQMESVSRTLLPSPLSEPPSARADAGPALAAAPGAWGGDGFSFGDLVDIVNPLQHIPVVSWAYRAITGDQIAPAAKLAGGGLFGGLPGLVLGVADSVVTEATGRNPGEVAMAWLGRSGAPDAGVEPPQSQVAASDQPPAPIANGDATIVSPSADALLMAAFGGGGAVAPAMLPGAVALPQDQAALLLASLGIPESARQQTPAVTEDRPNADANPQPRPEQRTAESAAVDVALPGDGLARLNFLTAAAAAGNDIGAMFGVR